MHRAGPPLTVLGDADVLALPAAGFVALMRRAAADAYGGRLAAPPRVGAEVHRSDLVFTAGGYESGDVGFRVYAAGDRALQQATLVWDARGELVAVVVGDALGERRTGALGGVAVDLLARPDASVVAVVGSGRQAWTQLWAAAAVRRIDLVKVFSPTPAHREVFASRAGSELGLPAQAVASAEEAVRGSDIVVLATRSRSPVIEAAWVGPGTHVSTVGPKTHSAHECPTEIPLLAAVAVTDAPDQTRAYPDGCFTERPLDHLGAVAAGEMAGRRSPQDVTFYLSTGLAGTEVVAAAELLRPRR